MNTFSRRQFLSSLSLAGSSLLAARAWGLQDAAPAAVMRPEARQAVSIGLAYLASRHNEDGTFGRGPYSENAAVVALAGMAFMANGSTPGRGPYGRHVNRCVDYLLNRAQESGFIDSPGHGPMYGHGFATMFLAECYGMSPASDIREHLERAVQVIVASQNSEGGWRYDPKSGEADISVTICQIMALRAARNAGVYVPNETVDRCIDYVKRCQNPDGGFMYMLSQPGDSRFPRSAAGVVALYSAGVYEGPEIQRGLQYLNKHVPRSGARSREDYYFYGQYYAVQAMWHAGGEHWNTWYPAIVEALLARQQTKQDAPDHGAWDDTISPEYGTAMACIILQMPNNYLPIFQH